MPEQSGKISDKIRALFTRDQILSNPRKPESKPMPKRGVEGIALSKPNRTVKKK